MDKNSRTVLDIFEQINRIPRCSGREQRIRQWIMDWAKDRSLTTKTDPAGNLVVRVPATDGFATTPVIILQGHMDMVCEKHTDSRHDFSKDPISMVYEDPWLIAKETTLGADNGIAIALSLALVDDPMVSHPPLELFFTTEEETGLTGAENMDASFLTGNLLINLDSEDEGVFVVGCAGGRKTLLALSVNASPMGDGFGLISLSVGGAKGGHSGVDIAKHRANAIKVLARILRAGMNEVPFGIIDLEGGTAQNVIPRTGKGLVACHLNSTPQLKAAMRRAADTIRQEYRNSDPELTIELTDKGVSTSDTIWIEERETEKIVDLLEALPSGLVEMTEEDPSVVQTSVNLAMVEKGANGLTITSSQRSSANSRLDAICQVVEAVGRLAGAAVTTDTGYPPWPRSRNSMLLDRCVSLYRELFDAEPTAHIMHAGLECAVIRNRFPNMDMISLGPTIENPHSPAERLHVPSIAKVWRLMVALLASFGKEKMTVS